MGGFQLVSPPLVNTTIYSYIIIKQIEKEYFDVYLLIIYCPLGGYLIFFFYSN